MISKNTIAVMFSQGAAMLYGGAFLILVPLNLTPVEQGFWFTLMALGAMSRLADLGFLQLVLTYSGHAKIGGLDHQDEVAFYTSQWRNKVIFRIFPLIFILGTGVLSVRDFEPITLLAWALYSVSLALLFYLNYFLAIIEGFGDIVFSHLARGGVYIVATLVTTVSLPYTHSLLILPLGIFVGILFVLFSVIRRQSSFRFGKVVDVKVSASLKAEFVKLFKKTSISWVGGYLGIHTIVPLVYIFLGPVASGFAGMTLNIFLALQNFSNVFLVSIIPVVTGHIASKSDWLAKKILLDGLYKALGAFVTFFFILVALLNFFPNNVISERVLVDENILFLAVGFCFQIIISFIAIYIRAHKQEPFALMSIITSTLGILVLLVIVQSRFADWVFIGFLISSLLAFLYSVRLLFIWKRSSD